MAINERFQQKEGEVKMLEQETVTISKSEYEALLDRVNFLDCLEGCGVDNWNGYSDAWEMFVNPEE